jgi:hypothetical protein
MMPKFRPSALAGSWYPVQADKLQKEVSEYIESASIPEINSDVIALIAPHAGYVYSGATAGHAFKAVQGNQYDLVVILSPFHDRAPAPLLTSSYDAYQTPLGNIQIDQQVLKELNAYLLDSGVPKIEAIGLEQEHSLEIELPYLQVALENDFKLLPVMIGSHDLNIVTNLGEGLAEIVADRKTLLVASTDLSHFYTQEQAEIYDAELLGQIERLSPKGIVTTQEQGKGFACGLMAVSAVLTASMALGATQAQILDYRTSAEVNGEYERVVGYGAAMILK